jgi:hypothetical protein
MQTENKICKKCKNEFELDQDDLSFYEKMKVPAPLVCPDCRFKMRAMWRNETTLYSGRKCDLCSKSIVTMYNPKSPYKVYCRSCFYSENWDPRDCANDFDFNKPYLDQLNNFLIKVPKIATYISSGDGENVNSDYVNMASGCKNCYLVFNTSPAEELMYSRGIKNGRFSSDLYFAVNIENCYESINIQESYGTTHSQNVISCVDSHFILNGKNLVSCFGCVNLSNKSYCILNEQYSKEDYTEKVNQILGSYQKMEEFKKVFQEFSLGFPCRENNNMKALDSTGDYIYDSKNVINSFEVSGGEDCKYLFASKNIKDSIGTIGYGTKAERLLECVATGYTTNAIGTYGAEHSQNVLNCFYLTNCTDCIGCDALKHGKYAVFNKEYSKEEYEKIKEHIVKELTDLGIYGLMMPAEISPFAYNETIGQDNMPLTREEAEAQGFRWEDDIQKTTGKETLTPENIPDHIRDVSETITHEVLGCITCSRNYKITEQELLFYKKVNLPIPRKCFYCRHQDRIVRRGPYKFWNRNCAKCDVGIVTNYSPKRPEIVYCEKCYQQEIY